MFETLRRRFEGSFLHQLIEGYSENDIPTRAAALSMYSMLSVFPFVAMLVWVSTISGSPREAHLWAARFSIFLPPDFAELIRHEIDYRLTLPTNQSWYLLAFHISLLVFSAGAALRSLLFSFREISEADDVMGLSAIVWRSILFVIPIIVFVFLASMIVAVVSFITIKITALLQSPWLLSPILWILMTTILVGVLNGVYASGLIGHQVVPIHGWLGAGVAASMISIVTIGLTMYFEFNPVNREWYGSPGFIINVLLWFYACSSCLLLGAQINAVWSERVSGRNPSPSGANSQAHPAEDIA